MNITHWHTFTRRTWKHLIFTILSLLLIFTGLSILVTNFRFIQNAEIISGRLVAYETKKRFPDHPRHQNKPNNTYYTMVITYQYQNKLHTYVSSVAHDTQFYPLNANIPLLVTPHMVKRYHMVELWILPAALCIMGILLYLISGSPRRSNTTSV